MELLNPSPHRTSSTLLSVQAILETKVWDREPYRNWTREWLEPLHSWASDSGAFHIAEVIPLVYPEEPEDGYRLIHGDPTLANLMIRSNGEWVLTDPMPRLTYRQEIPNRVEVDLGKLLQSAVGWERMLGYESSCWDQPDLVLRTLSRDMRMKTMLWGAIHLYRVSRRALVKGTLRIANWAVHESTILCKMLKVEHRAC